MPFGVVTRAGAMVSGAAGLALDAACGAPPYERESAVFDAPHRLVKPLNGNLQRMDARRAQPHR